MTLPISAHLLLDAPGEPVVIRENALKLPLLSGTRDQVEEIGRDRTDTACAARICYEALGLAENTYLIVTSDHGYMLGEKMAFSKFALWERALRVPLIIVGPGIKGGRIQRKPVSLLDLFPTICALVDLPIPSWCDGRNLAPWLLGRKRLIDQGVVSVWRQGGRNYWRSRNRLGSFIHNGGGPAEAYDHNRNSARYDRHEFHNIVETMDPKLKRKLKSLAPPRWARTV